jgi:hypothetical protein
MITTCNFRFVCPLKWDNMPDLPDGSGKHCTQCQRPVLIVHTRRQFNAAARRGDCVAVFPEGEEKLPVLLGVPLPLSAPPFKPDPADREYTPPYDWSEIEENLAARKQAPRRNPRPVQRPPCPRCHNPMRWIYFSTHPDTWENLCGREGWTPICRECRTWRACQMTIIC